MKTLMLSTVAALFALGIAHADVVKMDVDGDGNITLEEFQTQRAEMETVFGDWDADGDNFLSRDEYTAMYEAQDDADTFGTWDDRYGEWDIDADDRLSVDEYNTGLWATFDADDDDLWNEEESAAWEEDEMRYDATRVGAEVSGQ